MVENNYQPLNPSLEHAFDVEAEIEEPIEIGDTGDGNRRIIPISGGTVSGKLTARSYPSVPIINSSESIDRVN